MRNKDNLAMPRGNSATVYLLDSADTDDIPRVVTKKNRPNVQCLPNVCYCFAFSGHQRNAS